MGRDMFREMEVKEENPKKALTKFKTAAYIGVNF